MRLRLTDACPNGYSGSTGNWTPGSEKDVEEAEGNRLLVSFPAWFELVSAPVVEAPPRRTKPARGIEK